jgi:hypothetical protein
MITYNDLIAEVRAALDEAPLATGGDTSAHFTDAQITALILQHAFPSGVYNFTLLQEGYYYYPGPAYFFAPSFSEEADLDYEFNASGSIIVTESASPAGSPGATDSRTQIAVTAIRVNFYRVMANCFLKLANQSSKIVAQSSDAGTINASTVRSELMAQAAIYAAKEFIND